MSIQQQEQALLHLLFDASLRENFSSRGKQALKAFELTEEELDDFSCIRMDALEVDAQFRKNMILGQLSRHLPLTFSLYSYYEGGLEYLEQLVTPELMTASQLVRVQNFSRACVRGLDHQIIDTPQEELLAQQLTQAELGLAATRALLHQHITQDNAPDDLSAFSRNTISVPADWQNKPLSLASYVAITSLPMPYSSLKKLLCPVEGKNLWRYLQHQPATRETIWQIIENQQTRVLVARATITEHSICDPLVEHLTLEVSEGFMPLFQHLENHVSASFLIEQLRLAGAQADLLGSVESGFIQLIENRMLAVL